MKFLYHILFSFATFLQDRSKKSPMELISEVPPIKVDGRIVACEGGLSPLLLSRSRYLV